MEVFGSFALNMGGGVFVAALVLVSRTKRFRKESGKIILELPAWMDWLAIFTISYFGFAVLYNIVTVILKMNINPLPF
jgi:hypothetical protein